MLKDFDVTQIDKNTKAVVFRVPFCDYIHNEDSRILLENHLKKTSDDLKLAGIQAVFIDESMKVELLTDELLDCGNLKVIE